MVIIETATGNSHPVEIKLVDDSDYQKLTKARYFFDWKAEKQFEVYKLCIFGSNEILGLISLERIPDEWRIHIRLLTVSVENQGKHKLFDNIAGNLIAHAAKIAVAAYAELACVSLRPKTEIAKHYIETYNMQVTGLTLSIEVPEILNLTNRFDHD
ncbi:N-acetyltransferase [Kordia sp. YSTF-M3]|uniref:N-acetyltransferase n=1 Tax=Kordia aestuariivivens TaxID=2759037 RepID=A0ABR7QC79_9FLAO|nr:N-acetyltransferase [Kordia aestuariivivens]MBC8756123.1 N-acetyltransferase [Kordia aestuariivivens]